MTETIGELCFGGCKIPKFSVENFINLILDQQWHGQCEINIESNEPHVRPKVFVKHNNGTKWPAFLRYSCGPKQGFFWDIYGDDMQSVELAIIALSKAPYPSSVAPLTFKIPLHKKKEI